MEDHFMIRMWVGDNLAEVALRIGGFKLKNGSFWIHEDALFHILPNLYKEFDVMILDSTSAIPRRIYLDTKGRRFRAR